jgi:hypothetical protein
MHALLGLHVQIVYVSNFYMYTHMAQNNIYGVRIQNPSQNFKLMIHNNEKF